MAWRLLVVGCGPELPAIKAAVATQGDWLADAAAPAEAPDRVATTVPALVLLLIGSDSSAAPRVAEAIRRGGGDGAEVPILALADEPGSAAGFDGVIAAPAGAAIGPALSCWAPREEAPALARLTQQFGAAAVGGLLDGLAGQLREILACDRGDPGLWSIAHRLAGLAGTLGFAAVSAGWRSVSEGDMEAWARARIDTRRALHAITSGRARDPASG